MGVDDTRDCVEHLWRLAEVMLAVDEGGFTEYVCVRCGAALLVAPGGEHPATV